MPTEVLAGLTTFSTLSYILIVNPLIMAHSGMDHGALITITAVVGAIFTVIMGLWTNYPLAMAPAMGVNALLAIQVCEMQHVPWQAALGFVFYAGVLFFILSITGARQIMIEAFPQPFKKIIGAGIGMFIAYTGVKNGGLIVPNATQVSQLGSFSSPLVLVTFFGIMITLAMVCRRVPAGLVLSILIITVLGLFIPGETPHTTITPHPSQIFGWPNSMGHYFFQLDFGYLWRHPGLSLPIVLTIFFGDLLSAMGTLLAVGQIGGLLDANGNLPRLKQALRADSTAAMGGSLLGSNTPIIYIESAAGVEQGGRTGLVSIVVASCYLLALFFTPIIAIVPPVATTPALVVIGVFMMQGLGDLDLRDVAIAGTALVSILIMAFGSVSNGIGLGFVVCVFLLAVTGRHRTLTPMAYVLAFIFLIYFVVPLWNR